MHGFDSMKHTLARISWIDKNPEVVNKTLKAAKRRLKQAINLHWKWHSVNDAGGLSKSIFAVRTGKRSGMVGSNSPKAAFVFNGVSPHYLSRSGHAVLVKSIKRGVGKVEFWAKQHHGSKPAPYLEQAMSMFEKHDFERIFGKEINKIR